MSKEQHGKEWLILSGGFGSAEPKINVLFLYLIPFLIQ